MSKYDINPDIAKAHTLHTDFYTSKKVYDKLEKKFFPKTWQFVGDSFLLENETCVPFRIQKEELLLTKAENEKIHCLSNVCTHRGNILVKSSQNLGNISCRYHGRCFDLNGNFRSMPEFKGVNNFPSEKDNLKSYPLHNLGPFLFTSLDKTAISFESWIKPLVERMSWFPFHRLKPFRQEDRDYPLRAHWALYCDNYLEGFHVPFVHESLNQTIDYGSYTTEVLDQCILQIGYAKKGEAHFDSSHGYSWDDQAYAFYWHLFPNLMINFYSWGVSVNVVRPLSRRKTIISFRTYILDGYSGEEVLATGIHNTEMEDEEIVLDVQKGVRSKNYSQGRYSPSREQGVHHFHYLLSNVLASL